MPADEVSNQTPLYGHTVDSLCAELVSGRAVYLGDGEEFKFDADGTRAIFSWYVENKDKWAGRNMKEDVEKMVDRLKRRPPTKPTTGERLSRRQKRCLHLSKIRAHRFGGIHKYGSLTEAPPDFEYCFEKRVTLVEGKNASGKTSLLNAIVWCLTGYVYRSQREPEKVQEEIDVRAEPEDATESLCKTCLPITPVPDAATMRALKDRPVPLDTWVELTFMDDDGKEVGKVKRTVGSTPRGKISIDVAGIESLGVDPVALEIGTRVAGLIPYIQLEEASDLGRAIAGLTPLRPLEDLVKHARRSQEKLKGELRRAIETEIERLDTEYADKRAELKTLIETSPGIGIALEAPEQGADKTAARLLRKIKAYLEGLEAQTLGDCGKILGQGFDPQDASSRKDLGENVGKALGLLGRAHLKSLASAQRLTEMRELTEQKMQAAATLIETLLTQGREIEELARSPERAVRERLYARVGSWIRQNQAETRACPVCQEELGDRCDKVTGRRIVDHLDEHAKKDKEHLARAIGEWARSCRDKLKAELPTCLSSEMEKDLPKWPTDLIAKAFGEELFESIVFKGSLAPLRDKAQRLCGDILATLPEYQEPEPSSCSDYIRENCADLCKAILRVSRALAFARWRGENDDGCKQAFARIIGDETSVSECGITQEYTSDSVPLLDCLRALDRLNKNAAPLREAQLKVKALRETIRA